MGAGPGTGAPTARPFPPDEFDAIISNAAGCGSHLKHLGTLLADDPHYRDRAAKWDRRLKDIHEWLAQTGIAPPKVNSTPPQTVTYHEACHLCHGQKITAQPRQCCAPSPICSWWNWRKAPGAAAARAFTISSTRKWPISCWSASSGISRKLARTLWPRPIPVAFCNSSRSAPPGPQTARGASDYPAGGSLSRGRLMGGRIFAPPANKSFTASWRQFTLKHHESAGLSSAARDRG